MARSVRSVGNNPDVVAWRVAAKSQYFMIAPAGYNRICQ